MSVSRPAPRRTGIAAAVLMSGMSGMTSASHVADPPPLTFNRDIAPLVFEHCAACHRPGQAAPFSLLSYEDVKKRARQIVRVTHDRFMPPWLPADGEPFEGDRRLSDEEIAKIRRWVEEGAAEGDPADLPPTPKFTDDWSLGEPDLVVTMTEPFALRADGPDVFRDFVIPVPLEESKFVRALEYRPGNPPAVHHVIIEVDPVGSSRRLDAQDEEPGFEGMISGEAIPPDGHFIGWTPGKLPSVSPEGMAWRLAKGSDLILEMHMLPTGKPETVQSSIGLYFTDEPPVRHPFMILLGNWLIDIPAGEADYRLDDTYRLPVDIDVLGIYPHAHYLGKDLHVLAELPDGTTKSLIHIPDWDFNWQDEYRFVMPVSLPRGTTLRMAYRYDNTADNVRNPNQPPQRVVYGNRSTDEMGTAMLQVLARSPRERATLARDFEQKIPYAEIDRLSAVLRNDPDDAGAHNRVAFLYLQVGEPGLARTHLERTLALAADNSPAHDNLGLIFQSEGRMDEAVPHFREAVRLEPENVSALNNLAWALATSGDPDFRNVAEAIEHALLAQSLIDYESAALLDTLAAAYAGAGRFDDAIKTAEHAIELSASPRRRSLQNRIRQRLELYRQNRPYLQRGPPR